MAKGRRTRLMSIARLQQLLKQADSQLHALQKRRKVLTAELADIDRQIAVLQGDRRAAAAPAGPRRRRAGRRRGGPTLPQVVTDVLTKANAPMRLKDIVAAVEAAGYQSASKDFYNVVSQTLHTREEFKNVARGVYALGGSAPNKKARKTRKAKKKT